MQLESDKLKQPNSTKKQQSFSTALRHRDVKPLISLRKNFTENKFIVLCCNLLRNFQSTSFVC